MSVCHLHSLSANGLLRTMVDRHEGSVFDRSACMWQGQLMQLDVQVVCNGQGIQTCDQQVAAKIITAAYLGAAMQAAWACCCLFLLSPGGGFS